MIPFREKLPVRRINPTKSQKGLNWAAHKPELREDFHRRCGYCDAHDDYRHTYYEVDHFVPKDFCKKDKSIGLTEYSNLVYSCKYCNLGKMSLWPSGSATVFHVNDEGFIDPCDGAYADQFERTDDGMIVWKSELGKWMFQTAFKFDERADGIRLLYNIKQLDTTIQALTAVLVTYDESSADYKTIKAKIADYCFEYYKVHRELINFYH